MNIFKSNLSVVTCGLLFLVLQLVIATTSGVFSGELIGPDSYMRMNRVVQLTETWNWFDPVYYRINPPVGHEQHWTRPMDIIIVALSFLFGMFNSWKEALHLSAVWINFPLYIAVLIAVKKTTLQVTPITSGVAILCLLVLTVQVNVNSTFSIGRPDHQSLLFLLAACNIATWMLIFNNDSKTANILGLALSAALGVWVSVEFMLVIAVGMTSSAIIWLFGIKNISASMSKVAFLTTIFLFFFLLVEKGTTGLDSLAKDQISLVYIYIFFIVTVGWFLIHLAEEKTNYIKGPCTRLGLGIFLLILAILAAMLLDTGITTGPLDNVNPLYENTRLKHITEYQSLINDATNSSRSLAGNFSSVFSHIGLPLIAIVGLLLGKNYWKHLYQVVYFAVGTVLFILLTTWQLHWAPYAVLFAVVPYSVLANRLINAVATMRIAFVSTVLNIFTLLLVCTWPFTPLLLDMNSYNERGSSITQLNPLASSYSNKKCDAINMSSFINERYSDKPKRLVSFVDNGPEYLYRSHHSVFSIPNHRYQPGYNQTFNLLSATNTEDAYKIAKSMRADLILICKNDVERDLYRRSGNTNTLYDMLSEGSYPEWLDVVNLPSELKMHFQLYSM